MTQDEYQQAKTEGKVEQDPAPTPDVPEEKPEAGLSLEDFIPAIFPLLAPIRHVAAAPAFTPKTYLDSMQFVDNGSSRALYIYLNGAWRSVPLGGGSGAAGRSYLTTNQAFNTGSLTKVTFDANDYATGITWDGSNNRFVATAAGKYLVNVALQWSSPTANFSYFMRLYRNSTMVSETAFVPGTSAASASNTLSDIVSLAEGDTLEVRALQSSGGTNNLSAGSEYSYFNISFVSS